MKKLVMFWTSDAMPCLTSLSTFVEYHSMKDGRVLHIFRDANPNDIVWTFVGSYGAMDFEITYSNI